MVESAFSQFPGESAKIPELPKVLGVSQLLFVASSPHPAPLHGDAKVPSPVLLSVVIQPESVKIVTLFGSTVPGIQ